MQGRKIFSWTASVASLILVTGVLATAPASASDSAPGASAAQTCSAARYIYLPDKAHRVGSMKYTECQRTYNGVRQSSTAMWLWDNKDHDGLCATGSVAIGDWSHRWSWCDATKGSPKFVSGWHNGADAKVTLVV